jgi:hypothetical protein
LIEQHPALHASRAIPAWVPLIRLRIDDPYRVIDNADAQIRASGINIDATRGVCQCTNGVMSHVSK